MKTGLAESNKSLHPACLAMDYFWFVSRLPTRSPCVLAKTRQRLGLKKMFNDLQETAVGVQETRARFRAQRQGPRGKRKELNCGSSRSALRPLG